MSYIAPAYKLLIRSFHEGYLDTPEADAIPLEASPDALNCAFVNQQIDGQTRTILRRRQGSQLINPTPMATGAPVDDLFEYLPENATQQLIAICNGSGFKWDEAVTFNSVTGLTGFRTDGAFPVRMLMFKNNAFLYDALQMLRYNGTSGFPVGFIAPTAAPALAVGALTGLTGTYEGIAVWYDATMDHESSPTAASTQVAFANQSRSWTKPAGSPPANVTHWRIYCRRVDTNELNYFQVAQVAIATGSVDENTSDAVRQTNPPGPRPHQNDVPPAFAVMGEWKGFAIGAPASSSLAYFSKQYDAESFNPTDVFAIGGKGDTKPIQVLAKFGNNFLVQKNRISYQLLGERLPFRHEPIDASYGGVSQDAAMEVDGWFYSWDDLRGPYRTNLTEWQPLADARIRNLASSINRTVLNQTRVAHYHRDNLIIWNIATSTTRKRTLLAYNYRLDCWLPPITGFEYMEICSYTTQTGTLSFYFGDYWGRVYQLFAADLDGPPAASAGTVSAPITGATSGTITASSAAFYTTGAGLAGMPIAVVDAIGNWQFVRAQSNTATVITLDTTNGAPLSPVPAVDGTWTVYVGPIQWYWKTPQWDGNDPEGRKIARWVSVQGRTVDTTSLLNVGVLLDSEAGIDSSYTLQLSLGGALWGSAIWGQDKWGGLSGRTLRKHRIQRSFQNLQLIVWNYLPNQPYTVTALQIGADPLRRRKGASA